MSLGNFRIAIIQARASRLILFSHIFIPSFGLSSLRETSITPVLPMMSGSLFRSCASKGSIITKPIAFLIALDQFSTNWSADDFITSCTLLQSRMLLYTDPPPTDHSLYTFDYFLHPTYAILVITCHTILPQAFVAGCSTLLIQRSPVDLLHHISSPWVRFWYISMPWQSSYLWTLLPASQSAKSKLLASIWWFDTPSEALSSYCPPAYPCRIFKSGSQYLKSHGIMASSLSHHLKWTCQDPICRWTC